MISLIGNTIYFTEILFKKSKKILLDIKDSFDPGINKGFLLNEEEFKSDEKSNLGWSGLSWPHCEYLGM